MGFLPEHGTSADVIHLRPVGFIDISATMTKLSSYRDKYETQDDGSERFTLSEANKATSLLREWKAMTALLSRIRNEAAPFFGGKPAKIDAAFIERIKVGVLTPWAADETSFAEDHVRVMVCLVPSPGAWLYCGGENGVLGVGQLVLVNVRAMTSSANFGPCATVRLCLDVLRPEVDAPDA